MAGTQASEATPSFGRLCPAMTAHDSAQVENAPGLSRPSVLPFQRQAEDELAVHRHDGVEVEADMVVDRRHVAPGALQRMAMLQAAAAGGIEDQVDRRLGLIRDERLAAPAQEPDGYRLFAILPDLAFCCV